MENPQIPVTSASPTWEGSVSTSAPVPGVPSPKAQSWGTIVSIVIIVAMIVIGAFYAWNDRTAQNGAFTDPTTIPF